MNKFMVDEASEYVDDSRVFRNGKCVYNKTLGFAYSVDEIVEVFNHDHYYERVMDLMQNKIWYMQMKYGATGSEKYKEHEKILQELRDELYEPEHHSRQYGEALGFIYGGDE